VGPLRVYPRPMTPTSTCKTGARLSRGTFNALFRHIDCKSIHNVKRKIEASASFDENRQAKGAKALAGITYAAGATVLGRP